MCGLALLARQLGYRVSGSDHDIYPPMSGQLQGIETCDGYAPRHWAGPPAPDRLIVGNVLSRGNPSVEYLLNQGLPYSSGPQWLAEQVLAGRYVVAISGTHGKTTATAMLAWILHVAGLEPGFLIGGVAPNFGVSARLGTGRVFVLEADEYDSAFFDKRAKFIHYQPQLLIILNIEYDHADIYGSLADIRQQFHHLVRTVPGQGRILAPLDDAEIRAVLAKGCWTPVEDLATGDWRLVACAGDWSHFQVWHQGQLAGEVQWSLFGQHNAVDALSAIVCAWVLEVPVAASCAALAAFQPVQRRLQPLGKIDGATLYDDFAHHPSAIRAGLAALGARHAGCRRLAVLDLASNTMRRGVHGARLGESLQAADRIYIYKPPGLDWDLEAATVAVAGRCVILDSVAALQTRLLQELRCGDVILLMSNAGFGGLQQRLLAVSGQRTGP